MSVIKNLRYENRTKEVFRLVVEDSAYAGTYDIEMPDKFDEIDCIVNINEEFYNVDDFILGESEKISFLEYSNKIGFDIVKKVYEEKGSDGKILFQWKAINGLDEIDLLGGGYELNLNKYSLKYEMSMEKIEVEIKKREFENKFLTREDVSVNLFSEKDLDNNTAPALVLDDVYYKEGARRLGNFYFFFPQQKLVSDKYYSSYQFVFMRGDDYQLGINKNISSGYYDGIFITTDINLPNVIVEVSNLDVKAFARLAETSPKFEFNAVILNGATVVRKVKLEDFTTIASDATYKYQQLKIVNKSYPIGALRQGESLDLRFESKDTSRARFRTTEDANISYEILADLTTPLKKTKVIMLKDAIERLARLYTGEAISVESSIINIGGYYYNTAVSTGMFMRGLPEVYNTNKLSTSFKSLFYNSAAKLLALGFDIDDSKIVVEDIRYFFKDEEVYDFSGKDFLQEDFSLDNDIENSFNQLIFGSKKFSTEKKSDLLNYNTSLEGLTPLKSVKTKFDKTIDAIIDEYKISQMIADKSSATNANDDDLIMFDVVEVTNYIDEGILSNALHENIGGYLWITSYEIPFDTIPISVGGNLTIASGFNAGTYKVLEIDRAKVKLNKTTLIVEGNFDTPISYIVGNVSKNRTDEGFSTVLGVKDRKSCTNLRHNPKYQMARWFPIFGSALNKKINSNEIIVTKYKNNGDITIKPNSIDLSNELQGETTLNSNESLFKLRENKDAIFSGQTIEITISEVLFYEFFECYTNWRLNRGYISVNSPLGVIKIYPFGKKAFKYEAGRNELTIIGKIKNDGSAANLPILEDVTFVNSDTISMTWNYNGETYESGETLLQVSKDNVSWTTISTALLTETSKTVTSAYFDEVLSGTNLYFRVLVKSNYNAKSNVIEKEWTFNQIVFKQISLNENESCGLSTMEFEIRGSGTANITWNFTSNPTGGNCRIIDLDTNTELVYFDSPSGGVSDLYTDTETSSFVITSPRKFRIELRDARVVDNKSLSCIGRGTNYFTNATLGIDIENSDASYQISKILYTYGEKYIRTEYSYEI